MLQQAYVAVTASHAHGQYLCAGGNGRGEIFLPEEGADFSEKLGKAAPGFKLAAGPD